MRHPTLGSQNDGVDWKTVALQVFTPDEPFFFLVRQTFRRLGASAIGRLTAGGAIAGAGDLALVDLAADPEAGLAAIARLRETAATRPLLVAAPSSLTGPLAEARRLGIDGVVPKPVSGHELTLRVAEILNRPRLPPAPPPPLCPSPASASPVPAKPVPLVEDSRPAAARWSEADLAPLPVRPSVRSGPLDLAPLPPAPAAGPSWQDALEPAVAELRTRSGLDLGPLLVEHRRWLDSGGGEGRRLTLPDADLAGTDLSGAILPKATLRGVNLSDACLNGARLDGADLRQAVLSAADLRGADLGVATLRHAKLDLSRLEGTRLRGSDLSGAVLTGAHLAGADLAGAILTGADLRGADLSAVENLIQKQVEKTLCDLETRLPPGLSRPPGTEDARG